MLQKYTGAEMKTDEKFVNILGSTWKISWKDEDPAFEECIGYSCHATREIVIKKRHKDDKDVLGVDDEASNRALERETLRHEIIHAFLSESGLEDNSNECDNWATNEEMVDWFAIQSPKIFKLYKELDILEDYYEHKEDIS